MSLAGNFTGTLNIEFLSTINVEDQSPTYHVRTSCHEQTSVEQKVTDFPMCGAEDWIQIDLKDAQGNIFNTTGRISIRDFKRHWIRSSIWANLESDGSKLQLSIIHNTQSS